MKKFWIVLLSLGLLAAFSIPAFAVDVKFSGEYRLRGWYDDNASQMKKTQTNAASYYQGAQAFFDQRLRMQTDFKIADGLTLTTRFDALEKKWGDTTWTGSSAGADNTGRNNSATNSTKQQENIEFERAYVTFTTGIGAFQAGYMGFMAFGPDPANSSTSRAGIRYLLPIGNLTILAALEQAEEKAVGANLGKWSDADSSSYDLGFTYKFKGGDLGLIYQFIDRRAARTQTVLGLDAGYKTQLHLFDPYVRATLGPVYIEAEGFWVTGDAAKFDNSTVARALGQKDKTADQLGFFVQARVNLAPVYFGGHLGFAQGDDINTTDKVEGGIAAMLKAGSDFKPCLMMFNDDYATQFGGSTNSVANLGSYMDNLWFYQIYVGAKPTNKLDIRASYSVAMKEKDEFANAISKNIGQEIDVTAAYKIYDNLEYMIGGAYFITGDYFKGATSSPKEIDNDYMLMNKLTLSF